MMKKFFALAFLLGSFALCNLVSAAQVTGARWGVDKFNVLRLVVDLNENANYEIKMSDKKLNIIVDASTSPALLKTSPVKSSLANAMRLYNEGNKTIVELSLTKELTEKDYKGFALKNDPTTGRTNRIVLDVFADKKEAAEVTAPASAVNQTKTTSPKPTIVTIPSKTSTPSQAPTTSAQPAATKNPATNQTISTNKPVVSNKPTTSQPVASKPAQTIPANEGTEVKKPANTSTAVTKQPTVAKQPVVTKNKDKKETKSKPTITPRVKQDTKPSTTEKGIPALKATQKYKVGGGLKDKIIVIDPGHGGTDPGAIGNSGLKEKDVTLPISKLIKKALEDKGAKVYMSRTTDVDVCRPGASDRDELQARVNAAEKNNCDAFISVHVNASVKKDVGGISTYYYPKTQYDSKLASVIQNKLAKNFGVTNLGVREAGFYVIKRSSMPAILVELLFISNNKEEKLLQSSWFRKKTARLIAEGFEQYFK